MEEYLIGAMIKEYRKRFKLSQEDVCGNLLAVSTLSRIERGLQLPSRKTIEALFSRMGMTMPPDNVPMNAADFKRYMLEQEISDILSAGRSETLEKLRQYKACSNTMDVFEQQFYQYQMALYEFTHDGDKECILRELTDALRLTVTGFALPMSIPATLLTKMELMILNVIARVEYFMDRRQDAIALMSYLKTYFDMKKIGTEIKNEKYDTILFNLTNWISKEGDHEAALRLAEEAITFCSKSGRLFYFPFHVFNKGFCLAMLGRLEEGRECISLAYGIFDAMGRHDLVIQSADDVNSRFGYTFPTA